MDCEFKFLSNLTRPVINILRQYWLILVFALLQNRIVIPSHMDSIKLEELFSSGKIYSQICCL